MTTQDASDHRAFVDAWMERATSGLPPDRLIDVFELAFAALWRRANRTLGDFTLRAIADRVLLDAAVQHPILAPLEFDASGLQCGRLRASPDLGRDRLADGLRFVVLEFLSVLGNLTAEILTPSLHAELATVGPERETSPDSPVAGVIPEPPRTVAEEREP